MITEHNSALLMGGRSRSNSVEKNYSVSFFFRSTVCYFYRSIFADFRAVGSFTAQVNNCLMLDIKFYCCQFTPELNLYSLFITCVEFTTQSILLLLTSKQTSTRGEHGKITLGCLAQISTRAMRCERN